MKIKRAFTLLRAIVPALGICTYGIGKEEESGSAVPRRDEYQPGSYVTFGLYPQTEAGTDQTPIEWLVLENDGEMALLISRYALECQLYNTRWAGKTWKRCTLRKWLNNKFYNRAFDAEEKKRILQSNVNVDKNPLSKTKPGKVTKDSVFLLNIVEANQYFASDEERMCAATDYAIQQGGYTDGNYTVDGRDACWWWLRSPGIDSSYAASVYSDGSIRDYGGDIYYGGRTVRPCIRVRLS